MNKICVVILQGLFLSVFCVGQTIDEIKADRETYLWGEGKSSTVSGADKEALSALISQISTSVESDFELIKSSQENGGKEEFAETCKSIVKTYSAATLKNTERIVVSNEPDAEIFRYIKRSEIQKVFEGRKAKLLGFAKNAEKALQKNQIADALRYYYWSLTLLKSHPYGNQIKYTDENGQEHPLASWLVSQMNDVFAELDFSVAGIDKKVDYALFDIKMLYKKNPVENFDYSFWDGSDWSNIICARDGIGQVELYGMAAESDKIKLKAEYIFEGEARMDAELEDVLDKIDPVPFRHSYFTIDLVITQKEEAQPESISASRESVPLSEVQNSYTYQQSIDKILDAITRKSYSEVQDFFTTEGYDIFNKLISYGNARVIGEPNLKYIIFNDHVICRSVPMMFNFKTNNKQFVENVVFHFNPDQKVESITFSLSEFALNDIIKRDVWKESDRLTLVNFLEHYKTAYALKRLDYIEQIFADDALIITGSVVKIKDNVENKFADNKIVKYNRQSKTQYIRNLQHSFGSKEYINIRFEDSQIRKAGKGGDIYGVQIKQNYFSSNYGDVGYLFLMVDLNDPDTPIIHVRTWQPEEGINDSIFGLSDFN